MNITRQKGCKDILPDESILWQYIENEIKEICRVHNIQEIRTPVFEATELYARGVGDETDIVTKEMYTFLDKGNRSITLRPELTAGVVRAYIENGLSSKMTSPVKLWYTGKMYRYEKMQKGRYREFSQFGVEMFGSSSYLADIETIKVSYELLKRLNLADKIELTINSIGCKECRSKYIQKLKEYIKPNLDNMCGTCKIRYEKNPLRLLDCKVDSCKAIFEKPEIQKVIQSDFICEECAEHYKELKQYLDELNVNYVENKLLVRGLDYYNRTVFEIKSNNLGSQNAVCGGGRYDSLVKNLGGEDTPAVGWAMGMERLNSLLPDVEPQKLDAYIVSNSPAQAFKLAEELRSQGINVEFDLANKKFTKQLEKASKVADYALILGEDEINSGKVSVKNLSSSEQVTIDRKDVIIKLKG